MIGMKSVATSCLLILALAALANGFCYRKNPPKSQESAELLSQPGNYPIWVCVKSTDLTADLEKAPKINTTQVWFSMSSVETLKDGAFAKFAEKLVKIEIWSSGLKVIEDGALKGLKELKGLVLPRNELTSVKAAWFKETPKLLELILPFNRIQSLEIEFLKLLPALVSLDLRGNELTTLPNEFVKQLPGSLRHLNLFNNPLNYKQTMEVVEWTKAKDDKPNESKLKQLKYVLNVTRLCLDDKAIVEKTSDNIDKCVEDRMSNELQAIRVGLPDSTTAAAAATSTVAAAAAASSTTTVKP